MLPSEIRLPLAEVNLSFITDVATRADKLLAYRYMPACTIAAVGGPNSGSCHTRRKAGPGQGKGGGKKPEPCGVHSNRETPVVLRAGETNPGRESDSADPIVQ